MSCLASRYSSQSMFLISEPGAHLQHHFSLGNSVCCCRMLEEIPKPYLEELPVIGKYFPWQNTVANEWDFHWTEFFDTMVIQSIPITHVNFLPANDQAHHQIEWGYLSEPVNLIGGLCGCIEASIPKPLMLSNSSHPTDYKCSCSVLNHD